LPASFESGFLLYHHSCISEENFFEKRVAEYQKAGVLKKDEENDKPKFSLDEDF